MSLSGCLFLPQPNIFNEKYIGDSKNRYILLYLCPGYCRGVSAIKCCVPNAVTPAPVPATGPNVCSVHKTGKCVATANSCLGSVYTGECSSAALSICCVIENAVVSKL